MKYILMILPAAAIVCGIFTGRLPEVSAAVLESASGAVTLALTLCGAMALWSGLMKVAEEAVQIEGQLGAVTLHKLAQGVLVSAEVTAV